MPEYYVAWTRSVNVTAGNEDEAEERAMQLFEDGLSSDEIFVEKN